MTPSEMRKIRVKEIITKAANEMEQGKIANLYNHNPSREELDNGRFVSKYFDLVNNKQY